MSRSMGLDYGSKTIGVAISDPLGITAQALMTILRKRENKRRQSLAQLERIIEEYDVGLIVLGLPVNLNQDLGDRARRTLEFKEILERRTGLPVILWDERLTSLQAHRTLHETGRKRIDHKQVVDMVAAQLILQNYLDASQRGQHE